MTNRTNFISARDTIEARNMANFAIGRKESVVDTRETLNNLYKILKARPNTRLSSIL